MNPCIDRRLTGWRARHPQAAQWLWFVGLWCGGFLALTLVAGLIRLLFHFLK